MTRRHLIGTISAVTAAALASKAKAMAWKPKLGFLTGYGEANIEFARQEGFTCLSLFGDPKFDNDSEAENAKATLRRAGLTATSLSSMVNHTDPDPAKRSRANDEFARAIVQCAKLGIPYAATFTGNMPGRKLDDQVGEVVRVYHEKYFPLCQKYNVKIVWEPWPEGPNLATGPIGYEALFKAFSDVPYVGLQYDPSHFIRQFMDPIQCARDFVDKIWDVHLKDTEILWPVLKRVGIRPLNGARWYRYRLPGFGSLDWKAFFTVLMDAGYQGGMNIEHEDPVYGGEPGLPITDEAKVGLHVTHEFLKQFVPV